MSEHGEKSPESPRIELIQESDQHLPVRHGVVILLKPQTEAIVQRIANILDSLPEKLQNNNEYVSLGGNLLDAKAALQSIEEERKGATKPLRDKVTEINDSYKPFSEILSDFEKKAKRLLDVYDKEQEEERKRHEEAQRQAFLKEQKKIADAALKKAERAEQKGDAQKADFMKMQAEGALMAVPPTFSVPQKIKVPGVTFISKWKARVIDASKLERKYLMPDEDKLNKLADAVKGDAAFQPDGVEFYEDRITRAEKRR